MFNSVVLDVVIGLIFIYLLYSLLASILSEIAATAMGLRARNLREAIDRMLNDEKAHGCGGRLWDSIKLMKNPKNPVINAFYNHPEIKYQGSSGIYKSPSNFKAGSFSKAVIELLADKVPLYREDLENKLNMDSLTICVRNSKDQEQKYSLDPETARYIRSLWKESQGDIEKFKLHLENWFEKTMVHTLEWYKRKIRWVTFAIGFLLAWFFYADTFVIVKSLSSDKDARDKLVSMANTYIQNNQIAIDTLKIKTAAGQKNYNDRLDSLLAIKKQLQADMTKANSILGIGGFPPDLVNVRTDEISKAENVRIYSPSIDSKSLSCEDKKTSDGVIFFTCGKKIAYLFRLFYHHFFGFLITALAISLGAPFWFDLLNKIMKLRTSSKEEINIPVGSASATTISPLNRVG
jgi:hypothetical protein